MSKIQEYNYFTVNLHLVQEFSKRASHPQMISKHLKLN